MFPIISSNVNFAKREKEAETSIKLENQRLTRVNRKLAQNFNPVFGEPPSPSSSNEAVITRLASLYEDSEYGPGYFQASAQMLKKLLRLYKDIKTDPTSEMLFLAKDKNGMHIHFNTITRKKEVVIPVGHPGIDPIRIDIGKFRSWYKKQRLAAIAARNAKAKIEIRELNVKVAQAAVDRANSYTEQYKAEMDSKQALIQAYFERKEMLEIFGINNLLLNDELDKLGDLRNRMKKEVRKPKEEFITSNKDIDKIRAEEGMYEKKIFLEKMLKAIETATKKSTIVRDIFSSFNDEILLLNSNNILLEAKHFKFCF